MKPNKIKLVKAKSNKRHCNNWVIYVCRTVPNMKVLMEIVKIAFAIQFSERNVIVALNYKYDGTVIDKQW